MASNRPAFTFSAFGENYVKRSQAGLLALGSSYPPPLPIPFINRNSGSGGARPRLQRRVRDGFPPSSLWPQYFSEPFLQAVAELSSTTYIHDTIRCQERKIQS